MLGSFQLRKIISLTIVNICITTLLKQTFSESAVYTWKTIFFRNFTYNAKPVQNWALDPLLGQWSHLLKGRKVLVISPFAEQIESQYKKRTLLFPNSPSMLPDFELITIKAVQTMAEQIDPRFGNWFEALDYMKVEILKHEFDVALVGAGAYGSPLCLYIKSLNKQAIQTGGATQLLFGIIGRRWENRVR